MKSTSQPSLKLRRWTLVATAVFAILGIVACTKSSFKNPLKFDNAKSREEVIYGDDNRVDYFEEQDPSLRNLSESTVALMSQSQIGASENGLLPLTGTNYGTSLNLCPGEKFAEQNTGAFCSGFLIGTDLVVTAGHCIPDLQSCEETSFVFGYHLSVATPLPTSVPEQDVYSCAALLHSQSPSHDADFAVVKLDRPVTNHPALKLRLSGDIAVGTDITVMGYPEGLPLKIAGGAQVRSTASPGFFVANTDTYGGNSGSAVINSLTHEVEGVLVRGEKDFEWSPEGCARSYRCKADACRGEDVTRIGEIVKMLNSPALR